MPKCKPVRARLESLLGVRGLRERFRGLHGSCEARIDCGVEHSSRAIYVAAYADIQIDRRHVSLWWSGEKENDERVLETRSSVAAVQTAP